MTNDNKRLRQIVYAAPSTIHGKGLFAKVPISEGEYIGTYLGPRAKRNGSHVLWVCEEGKEPVGRRGLNLLRYLNHHDKPIAEFDGFDLYALRDIGPDEELTINYESA